MEARKAWRALSVFSLVLEPLVNFHIGDQLTGLENVKVQDFLGVHFLRNLSGNAIVPFFQSLLVKPVFESLEAGSTQSDTISCYTQDRLAVEFIHVVCLLAGSPEIGPILCLCVCGSRLPSALLFGPPVLRR